MLFIKANVPDYKDFKQIKTFKNYAVTNFKIYCDYLLKHHQFKQRLNFLRSSAFLKKYT